MIVLLFARLTLQELVRRRLVFVAAAIAAAIVAFTGWGLRRLATAAPGGVPLSTAQVHATAAGIVIVLAFLFSFVLALGAAVVAAPSLGGDIESGTILAIAARPVRRAEIIAGRWLGAVGGLAVVVALAGGTELGVVRLFTGYVPPQPLTALVALFALSVVVATAALLLATRVSWVVATIAVVLLFGLGWVGGIVEATGIALNNTSLADGGTIAGLIFPTDAIWRTALYHLEPAVLRAAAATMEENGAINPVAVSVPPPPAMLVWAALWTGAAFAGAIALFGRRDL